MAEYRVKWIIDVDADSPEEAALLAEEIMLDHDSTANSFVVRELNKENAEPVIVDLDKLVDGNH